MLVLNTLALTLLPYWGLFTAIFVCYRIGRKRYLHLAQEVEELFPTETAVSRVEFCVIAVYFFCFSITDTIFCFLSNFLILSAFQNTYYSVEQKNGREIVDGRLFHKFYNTRRYLIKVGLLTSSRLQRELEEDEELDGKP